VRAIELLKQTADALQAAHDLGIVHRDLKPDNIMLAHGRSGEEVVKVVDFGIAKAMSVEEGQKVTKTGLVVGTPEYMSPEQLSGDVLDGRSDIYSLALVFYRMLTGTLPFEAITAQEIMIKRLTDEPLPLNAALPGADFPVELQRTVDRALARMPTDRYGSAMAFANDAATAVQGMSPEATTSITNATTQLMQSTATERPPTTRVSGAPGRRARPSLTPDTPAPRSAPVRPTKKAKWPIVVGAVVVLGAGGGTAAILLNGNSTPNGPTGGDSITSVRQDPVAEGPEEAGSEVQEAAPPTAQDTTRPPPLQVPPPDTTGGAEGPALDAAELGQRLRAWEEALVIDESTAPHLLDSLLALYNREDMSNRDRAKAASLIAYWYSAVGQGDVTTLCPWYHRADSLDPGRYQPQLRDFCQQD
jgi:serine/threonine-protein kinase